MKKLLLTFLIAITCTTMFGQEVYDSIANEICSCLSRTDANSKEQREDCYKDAYANHITGIMKAQQVAHAGDVNSDTLISKIVYRLKNCVPFVNAYTDSTTLYNKSLENKVARNYSSSQCAQLHNGDYYYVLMSDKGEKSDTTYVSFKDSMYLERMDNGRTYSLLSVKWPSACQFVLTFLNSDDKIKNALSQYGDTYEYQIVNVEDSSFVVRYTHLGKKYFLTYHKIKN